MSIILGIVYIFWGSLGSFDKYFNGASKTYTIICGLVELMLGLFAYYCVFNNEAYLLRQYARIVIGWTIVSTVSSAYFILVALGFMSGMSIWSSILIIICAKLTYIAQKVWIILAAFSAAKSIEQSHPTNSEAQINKILTV